MTIIQKANASTETANAKERLQAINAVIASGILEMSEIAFDRRGTLAAMSYRFYCGPLCGHGETLVFEKSKGQWIRTSQTCDKWVS